MKIINGMVLLLIALLGCQSTQRSLEESVYEIPQINHLQIDGENDEWQNTGLEIPLIANKTGEIDLQSFNAFVKLAWTEDGLGFFTQIEDDLFQEKEGPIWFFDGMEIFIVPEKGSKEIIQHGISPGIVKEFPNPRTVVLNHGKKKFQPSKIKKIASVVKNSSYQVEGLIPLNDLGIETKAGSQFGFNIYVNDADGKTRKPNKYAWHFNEDAWMNGYASYPVKLVDSSSPSEVNAITKAVFEDTSLYKIAVFSTKLDFEGSNVIVQDNQKEYAKSLFENEAGILKASFEISDNKIASESDRLEIISQDQQIGFLTLPDVHATYVNIARPNNFETTIRRMVAENRKNPPPENATLFIGSSSFVAWKTMAEDFKEIDVINHGFGGSTAEDALYFFDRLVKPYKPSRIVYFEGSNDLGRGDEIKDLVKYIEKFIVRTQEELPNTDIILLSIKYSVTRKHLIPTVKKANKELIKLADKYDFVQYVDVASVMLNERGMPKSEIFVSDSTHMNAKGYALWTEILRPVLTMDF